MWYNVDWNRFAILMLPGAMRKPRIAKLMQLILLPIDTLHQAWQQWREENLYKIEHTGQVCLLRKSLNDTFDAAQRRIYIGNGQLNETQYIYTEAEAQEVYTGTEAEAETLYLRTEAETADTGLDFIVYVPQEVFDAQVHALHGHIKYYKVGGKRYAIITFN